LEWCTVRESVKLSPFTLVCYFGEWHDISQSYVSSLQLFLLVIDR
jgi:hypothetical protein